MRRILPILAMAALTTALFTSPVLAKHVNPSGGHSGASCVVTPSSAPAGSTFTAVCTGFPKNQPSSGTCNTFPQDTGAAITWEVLDGQQVLFYAHQCSATDSQGGFTASQIIPVAGDGYFDAQVRIGCCTNLTDANTRFLVTV